MVYFCRYSCINIRTKDQYIKKITNVQLTDEHQLERVVQRCGMKQPKAMETEHSKPYAIIDEEEAKGKENRIQCLTKVIPGC